MREYVKKICFMFLLAACAIVQKKNDDEELDDFGEEFSEMNIEWENDELTSNNSDSWSIIYKKELEKQTSQSNDPFLKNNSPTLNENEFNDYFSQILSGHTEARFVTIIDNCPVYATPDKQGEVVEYLEKNSDVHALSIEDAWVAIAYDKYVELKNLKHLAGKTDGK